MIDSGVKTEEYRDITPYWLKRIPTEGLQTIYFSYGYIKRHMYFECEGVTMGQGKPEWGAPPRATFIIKIGKRLNNN